jgi:Tol biopolymer transport system component
LWTPDGERVLFSALAGKRGTGIYSAPADGSGEPELLVLSYPMALPLAWTPDGKILLYHLEPSGGIWSLAVQAKGPEAKPRKLFDATFRRGPSLLTASGQARISPDGRWIAYTSDETGTNQIYIRSFSQTERTTGAKTVVSIEGGQEPRWSPGGRELFFRDPATNQLMAVDLQIGSTIRAGRPRALFELHSQYLDIAPDGRFLAVRQADTATRPARMQVVVNWFEELRQKAPVR